MLVCTSCDAALAVPLNSLLPASAIQTLCSSYRTKIATNHSQECPFRIDAELSLIKESGGDNGDRSSDLSVVPGYMTSVLSPESLQLLEHSNSTNTLLSVMHRMKAGISEDKVLPLIDIPSNIREFEFNGESGDQVLAALVQKLKVEQSNSLLVLLAILGWTRIDEADIPKNGSTLSLGCPCCLAWMDLQLVDKSSQENTSTSRAEKRSRHETVDPLKAHRHYCPFLVGFPSTATGTGEKPGWQRILERSVPKEDETQPKTLTIDEDEDQTFYRLRNILRAGISKKRPSLSAD